MLVGLLLVAAPYMGLIGGVSNKPTVNDSLKKLKKLVPFRSQLLTQADKFPTLLFAEFWNGEGSQSVWAVKAIFKETVKTSHYAPFALGLFGVLWFRKKMDAAFAVVLIAGLLQGVLLFVLAMKPMPTDFSPGVEAVPPYVSERHTLLLAYLACLFTGGLLTTDAPIHFVSAPRLRVRPTPRAVGQRIAADVPATAREPRRPLLRGPVSRRTTAGRDGCGD